MTMAVQISSLQPPCGARVRATMSRRAAALESRTRPKISMSRPKISIRTRVFTDDDDANRHAHSLFFLEHHELPSFPAPSIKAGSLPSEMSRRQTTFIAHASDASQLAMSTESPSSPTPSEDALRAAIKLPTRETTHRVFHSRGSEKQFEPSDLIERFVADVDEHFQDAVSQIKAQKCQHCKHGYSDVVLFQAFDWISTRRSHGSDKNYYERVLDRVDLLASYGVTHAWLPPPSLSVSPEGYMPSELYNLDASEYGDKASLKTLIAALKSKGIVAVADVVINHRCAEYTTDGRFKSFADEVTPSGRKINWGAWAIAEDDPCFEGTGASDSGDSIAMAPDLDHSNPEIRDALIEWLTWLRDDVGFDGWRFDFVQGYAPEYAREYVEKTVGFEKFCCAENWVGMKWTHDVLDYDQNAPRRVLLDWLAAAGDAAALFDFPTKGILQEAIRRREFWRLRDSRGGPPGLAGYSPQNAVLFVDNHDTGYPQNHWPFPTDRLGCGYAYALLHPGIPCVFGPHVWCADASQAACWNANLPREIKTLLDIRRRAGICCESTLTILEASSELYMANVDDKLIVKLGPMYDVPRELLPSEDEFALATSGDDYAVWMRRGF